LFKSGKDKHIFEQGCFRALEMEYEVKFVELKDKLVEKLS
jgi:hypothetical protein